MTRALHAVLLAQSQYRRRSDASARSILVLPELKAGRAPATGAAHRGALLFGYVAQINSSPRLRLAR